MVFNKNAAHYAKPIPNLKHSCLPVLATQENEKISWIELACLCHETTYAIYVHLIFNCLYDAVQSPHFNSNSDNDIIHEEIDQVTLFCSQDKTR